MKTLTLLLAMLLSASLSAQPAETFYNNGLEKHGKKDYAGAIAE